MRKLVEGYFALKPLGPARIKGVSEPINVYEVTGLGSLRTRLQRSAGRGLTKFVGREREMDAMKAAAERTKAGHGQIVAAMAEPGVGKSRLLFEFKATSQSGWMVLETYSVSHGKASAYLPVIDLLHGYFKILAEDDTRTRREKINGRVITLDRGLEDALPYLFGLLGLVEGDDPLAGMDAQVRRRRTLDAIKRIILRESLKQPLMLLFEDLHWIDEETQALLNLLIESIGNAKVLLLVNYRPEYTHQWSNKTYYTQLRLDPLGTESAEEMLSALLGDDKDLLPLKRMIVERTEGTPFFMEEMVQVLFEDGVLQRNGTVKLAKSMNAVKVPATVQAILASRIDRLPPDEKELLQTLAVIGREFALSLVGRMVDSKKDEELERMLGDLQMAEFIYEQPATGDIEYTFKHALTQEVAYNSVLLERRRVLHERAGDAIETLYPTRLDDHLAELAHHYGRSANLRKAVHYLGRAGNQALERSAFSEGRILLSRGLELLKGLPDDTQRAREEIDSQTALGFSLFAMGAPGGSEREAAYVRARELSERLGDKAKLIEALTFLSNVRVNRAELQPARDLAEQAVAMAELVENPRIVARAHYQLGQVFFYQGAYAASREHLEQAHELFGPGPYRNFFDAWYARWNAYYLVLVAAVSGYPDTALKRSSEALSAARCSSDPDSIGVALHAHATLVWELGDPRMALGTAEELLALSAEHDMPLLMLIGSCWRGWALAAQGQVEEGITALQRARAASAEAALVLLMVLHILAEVYLWGRRSDEGLDAVADGLAQVRKTGAGSLEPELHRIRGDLLLLQGPPNAVEAERCFRQAIQITRDQNNRLWKLRATTSLARLLAKQGRRAEAQEMLADIYNWFTEGFDTADLKDAKALLDELNK